MSSPRFFSRADVRDYDRLADARFALPTRVLMETAGRGAADTWLRIGGVGPVVVCCGKGNNGGDGLVMARHLASRGVDTRVLLAVSPDQLSGASAENWRAIQALGRSAAVIADFDADRVRADLKRAAWVVDALFGIGLTSPVRPPFDRWVEEINASGAKVLAIDVPSGLDADTGEPLGPTVRASHTVTFVAPKLGFANRSSVAWTGVVHVVDLGLPADIGGGTIDIKAQP